MGVWGLTPGHSEALQPLVPIGDSAWGGAG